MSGGCSYTDLFHPANQSLPLVNDTKFSIKADVPLHQKLLTDEAATVANCWRVPTRPPSTLSLDFLYQLLCFFLSFISSRLTVNDVLESVSHQEEEAGGPHGHRKEKYTQRALYINIESCVRSGPNTQQRGLMEVALSASVQSRVSH